jgi:hypothetical protein
MIKKAYKVTIHYYYNYTLETIGFFKKTKKLVTREPIKDIEFICYPDEFYICLEKNINREFMDCIKFYVPDAQKEILENWDYCMLYRPLERNITIQEALDNYTLDEMEKFVEIFNFPIDKLKQGW